MKKILVLVMFSLLTIMSVRANVLFQDSSYYPYTNGCIEGQGLWYCYSPKAPLLDALVTNDVLILNTTNTDSVATPTNGFVNSSQVNYASFTINVSALPSTQNGAYFCDFQDTKNNSDCHIFIDTIGTTLPGTYRLGIANYSSSFVAFQPPNNYPLDLVTGVTYNVVFLFDNNQGDPLVGATLWINPSLTDYQNAVDNPTSANGFVYGTDTGTTAQNNITNSLIGFSPYVNAGVSNVIIGTTFNDVNTTNPPVIGVQPQSGTNYSGNSATFYTVASGVDLTYQWYSSPGGMLIDDGVNIIGSTSNILVLNNLSATANYYVVATDAYGNTATSATATNTVITTPTAPFFPYPSLNLTNNLFAATGFTNVASGTGPLFYQWYFAPTNTPIIYSQLVGQTSSSFIIPQLAYTNGGSYFVMASNAIAGGSIAYGPTNTITVVAPVVATILQLHTFMAALSSQITKSSTVYVNSNNVTISGYVTSFGPICSATVAYSEYFLQDATTNGIYVYYSGTGVSNTVVPAVGSYVTISGPIEVYHGELEIVPTTNTPNYIATNTTVPISVPAPQLANGYFFNQVATNALGPVALAADCSLISLTNVYVYTNRTGGSISGLWYSNGYSAYYITEGPYHSPDNTNTIEIFVPAYNKSLLTNLWTQSPPISYYQLTGPYVTYGGVSEIEVTRSLDMVTNAPPTFSAGVTLSNGVPTLNWPAQPGSTYSVYSATNLLGPWTQTFGLSYYPSTGIYTATNAAATGFYRISTP